mgnify:CR=1 FL=1
MQLILRKLILSVSIHAPARGATTERQSHHIILMFQSTHPHGVRPSPRTLALLISGFQSTHPHGVRLTFPRINADNTVFQSTHPHGVRRFPLSNHTVLYQVSIHAPARGATYSSYRKSSRLKFQSTHPHGVRPFVLASNTNFSEFQSTHPHGVRPIQTDG